MAVASVRSPLQARNDQVENLIREIFPLPASDGAKAVSQIVRAYLFSTDFPSIYSFVRYCQWNDSIELPSEQPLIVRNVSLIRNNKIENGFPGDDDLELCIRRFIDGLISPLGKGFSVEFSNGAEKPICRRQLNEKICSLSYGADSTWKVESQPANLYFSNLMQLMVAFSIHRVVFKSSVIFWGWTAGEHALLNRSADEDEVLNAELKRRMLPELKLPRKKEELKAQLKRRMPPVIQRVEISGAEPEIYSEGGHFGISFSKGFEISIQVEFRLSISQFLEWIERFSSINVPPCQEFSVCGSRIESIVKAYDGGQVGYPAGVTRVPFIFKQLVVHLGKSVLIQDFSGEPGAPIFGSNDSESVKIQAPNGLEMRLIEEDDTYTTLELLGRAMLENPRYSSFGLAFGQRLVLYGFSEKERADLRISLDSDDLFPRHNFPGKRWICWNPMKIFVTEASNAASQSWPVVVLTPAEGESASSLCLYKA